MESCISNREDIPDLCVESLGVIKSMDKVTTSIEGALDESLNVIKMRERVTKRKKDELENVKELVQQISEMKVQIAVANYDLLDRSVRMIDDEIRIIEKAMERSGDERLQKAIASQYSTAEGHTQSNGGQNGGKVDMWGIDFDEFGDNDMANVDPSEPVYCFCRQIAFGDMIACDNEECSIEWFHYQCVNLTKQPRNKWLCPDCSRKMKNNK